MQQTITLTNAMNVPMNSQPIRQGMPWPRGAVAGEPQFLAMDDSGHALPTAGRVLNRWPDGSVQWSLVDVIIDMLPDSERVVTIAPTAAPPPAPVNPVVCTESPGSISITNDLLTFGLSTADAPFLRRWDRDDRVIVKPGGLDVIITDESGVQYSAEAGLERCTIEDASPLRAVIRAEGRHRAADGRTLLDYWMRFTVTADRPDVRITYHYHNREDYPDDHPGVPQARLRSMRMQCKTDMPVGAERAIVHATRGLRTWPQYYRLTDDLEICSADSTDISGYEALHQGKGLTGGGMGRVFIRDLDLLRDDMAAKPWFLRNMVDFKFGSINQPEAFVFSHVGLISDAGSLVAAGLNMVGLHPKALSVTGSTLSYDVWPEWAGIMDITQGEGRTLDFCLGALEPNATDEAVIAHYLTWERGSVYAHHGVGPAVPVALDPDHVRRCEVFTTEMLPVADLDANYAFERKVRARWVPDAGVPPKGHWNYGDIGGDWVTAGNNIEMAALPFFQEYLRTGRAACLDVGVAQAQHIIDVDLVAKSSYPYQEGGMVAHAPRHNHGAAYPSHMWFTELLYAYALTGDQEFLDAAGRTCDNLVFWINDPWGFEGIDCDGREAGQPLINLAWTYEFLPDPRYLEAMRRVVHECYIKKVEKFGRLTYLKPHVDMPLIQFDAYGDWAAWEGMFWVWRITQDQTLRQFMLDQFEQRLVEDQINPAESDFRQADYNAAAFAYCLSGDERWLHRLARPFRLSFRAVQWPFAWVKSMYYIKLAFEHGIVNDDDVLIG
ncbi:MAG: hypothetical protein CMJ49_04370 [Planctomycetaceae bacterium]|nr:hypothetical protein [Planctomycetaceae bacterium]